MSFKTRVSHRALDARAGFRDELVRNSLEIFPARDVAYRDFIAHERFHATFCGIKHARDVFFVYRREVHGE